MDAGHGNTQNGGSAEQISRGLAALSRVTFGRPDASAIIEEAGQAVATLAPCRVEAGYLMIGGEIVADRSHPQRADLEGQLRAALWDGPIELSGRNWAWAFALRDQAAVIGCLLVSASEQPSSQQMSLLTILARQAGAALAGVVMRRQLDDMNGRLVSVIDSLRTRSQMHEVLGSAVASGSGERGIVDALHDLTAMPVALEDRFGNLRRWVGPGLPHPYTKPDPEPRERVLHELAAANGPLRVGERVVMLVKPRAEILGVLALIDPRRRVTEEQRFALRYASGILGLELSHKRNLAELELNLRREFVDDLVAGADQEGAYARSEALGHDLRRTHYVVVVQATGMPANKLAGAARRAATALHLDQLQGRHAGMVVLIVAGRPQPQAFHDALTTALGSPATAVGIGTRCAVPGDIAASFGKACRALNIRLHSSAPAGASAYEELGFYRLVDAAHAAGAAEDFVREWLGVLMEYDAGKHSDLLQTLSSYLECGGNYDESAAVLHIHRSTLRYRLARIAELTGYDLRNADTRFNLHAATRVWLFLSPSGEYSGIDPTG
ncbi:helix-turn-helix domain-containing protein [Mycobacterium sp.]|jgi:hypothetical protein|uniref:PucR family transcriptional regulator n=1 Tax=Mycobacterium sp. TaxID=1785 RepID=UPI002D6771AA|nr:helix-turn-helix domain-containing protein [Mycobacterium sp.]HZA10728.1 helix-turn-helix domain-containing protein [Mycobacterium sp.]